MDAHVITIDEIRKLAGGIPFEVSNWIPGQPKITVRVKGIDMTPHIMQLQTMPNTLKTAAYEVFNGNQQGTANAEKLAAGITDNELDKMLPLIDTVVSAMLVEPKFEEIQSVYPLTLKQKMELFKFAMKGVDELESFRAGQE